MKQTKLLLLLATCVFMAACGGDDDAPSKLPFKQKIIGEWVFSENDDISLKFTETILTYIKEDEQFRFPYTFTTQNNNINVSYSSVLYSEDEGLLWGQYAPNLTTVPGGIPAGAQVYSVPGWTFAGSIDNYRIFGYAVKYKSIGVGSKEDIFTTHFFESFSQNWKIVSIETKDDETTMTLETARLSENGEPRLATETYTLLVETSEGEE
ncbi:hypothetical protein EZS27_014084 [termite gut metagenome]|uniref:Uncharacterized protein n=1 Tax=termite gut metagenome TaxID=433724 RepID=A0A5J4RXS6_9ZZZZ